MLTIISCFFSLCRHVCGLIREHIVTQLLFLTKECFVTSATSIKWHSNVVCKTKSKQHLFSTSPVNECMQQIWLLHLIYDIIWCSFNCDRFPWGSKMYRLHKIVRGWQSTWRIHDYVTLLCGLEVFEESVQNKSLCIMLVPSHF